MNGELAAITGPQTALVAGLVTSLHCAGMCGPLACAVMPVRRTEADPMLVGTAYHVSRLLGYTTLGALAGGIGRLPLSWLDSAIGRFLPWLLVGFFALMALRLESHLPRVPGLGRVYGAVMQRLRSGSRLRAAAALGFATPLLPCGPLYFVLSLALLSGSAARGAETLLAFGLGTVPLLWLAQMNFHWLRGRVGLERLARWRAVFAGVVALVLAWRLRGTLGLGGPGVNDFACF